MIESARTFEKQVALITGSTKGIGREIAEQFANHGATAVILGRSEDLGKQVVDGIHAAGGKAEFYACDVTDMSNVQEIIAKILDKHKRIDILVNNAGVTKDNLLLRMSEDDWDTVLKVNLRGAFNCTKIVSKAMLKAKKGKIINIASIIGILGNVGQANYSASKAGIIGFTKSVALELASRGITVNAIAPGYIQTDMTAQLNESAREELLRKIPLGKLGEGKDVAGTCLFLASCDADYITGQTIIVDGGMAI